MRGAATNDSPNLKSINFFSPPPQRPSTNKNGVPGTLSRQERVTTHTHVRPFFIWQALLYLLRRDQRSAQCMDKWEISSFRQKSPGLTRRPVALSLSFCVCVLRDSSFPSGKLLCNFLRPEFRESACPYSYTCTVCEPCVWGGREEIPQRLQTTKICLSDFPEVWNILLLSFFPFKSRPGSFYHIPRGHLISTCWPYVSSHRRFRTCGDETTTINP